MSGSEKKIRWWPLPVIAALAIVALIWVSRTQTENQQNVFMMSVLTVIIAALLAASWFFFFARLSQRVKRIGTAVMALGCLVFFALFEIREVSGNFVPIFAPRWASDFRDLSTDIGEAETPVTVASTEHDYPRFQGPNQNNAVAGPMLATSWEDRQPIERWRIDIGAGWSSFAIVGDLAVTQEQRGDQEMVTCYDLATGAPVWGHGDDALYASTIGGNGPRATPTVHEGKVYTMGATGLLNCLSLADGALVWQRDAARENAGRRPEWGYAGSPLISGDEVVVVVGGPDGKALAAYDRLDGTPRWTAGSFTSGYATPRLHTLAGVPQIVVFYLDTVAGHDPATGAVLWQAGWGVRAPTTANPLQIDENSLLVSSGYGVGCGLLRLRVDGDEWQPEWVYESPRLKAKFANYVLFDGHVYGLDDSVMACIDPMTGDRVWKRGRFGHGQLLLVGDMLLVQSEEGDLLLVEPTPEELRVKGEIAILDTKAWNTMAISNNRLLMRNHKNAVCLELPVRATGSRPPEY